MYLQKYLLITILFQIIRKINFLLCFEKNAYMKKMLVNILFELQNKNFNIQLKPKVL